MLVTKVNNLSQNGVTLTLTVNFCITNFNETKNVREIDSKLKFTLPNPEYETVHKNDFK